jgi:sialic acid synthase SpsE
MLKQNFANRIVFADHVDGKSDDAIWLPIFAALAGADVIEKHVMLEDRETKYDHFSSLTPGRFSIFVNKLSIYLGLQSQTFLNTKETEYLSKSMMTPILKESKPAGSILSLNKDFFFKRSGKSGLNVKQIEDLQQSFHLLSTNKK